MTQFAPDPQTKRSAAASVRRRWRVPPPVLRDPAPIEGLSLLREVPGEAGGLLWASLRNVLLWAETGPAERVELFGIGVADSRLANLLAVRLAPALVEPLEQIARLLAAPAKVRPEVIMLACQRIALHLGRQGHARSELTFLEAAARAVPGNSETALAVGKALRDAAEYRRAESWLRRSYFLARQAEQWKVYGQAHAALGRMFAKTGAYPNARRHLSRAMARARRHHLPSVEASALHTLFTLEAEVENFSLAALHAEAAFEAYQRAGEVNSSFAHDIAYFWMLLGEYEAAFDVFTASTLRHARPIQALVKGGLARCAGALGRELDFERARRTVLDLGREDGFGIPDAYLDVARGAAALDHHDEAMEWTARAEAAARERGDTKVLFEIDLVRADLIRNAPAAAERATMEWEPGQLTSFAPRLVASLSAPAAGTH